MSGPSFAQGLAQGLERLERGLEGLLTCLEAPRSPAPEALDAAWRHVLRDFEDVRAGLEGTGRGAAEGERVTRCLRLYAVATGLLARRREELAAARTACSSARARLRRSKAEGQSGRSCDVRG